MQASDKFNIFGYTYFDVRLEKIEKLTLPCFLNGDEYVTLNPKDTECDFNYFRLLNEEPIYNDLGGCAKIFYETKNTYKWVYFSKKETNIDQVISLFQKIIDVKIKSIQRNANQLIKSECGFTFDVRLKNYTYFSLDFEIKEKFDNCPKNDCNEL
jgi:hypothetical protein